MCRVDRSTSAAQTYLTYWSQYQIVAFMYQTFLYRCMRYLCYDNVKVNELQIPIKLIGKIRNQQRKKLSGEILLFSLTKFLYLLNLNPYPYQFPKLMSQTHQITIFVVFFDIANFKKYIKQLKMRIGSIQTNSHPQIYCYLMKLIQASLIFFEFNARRLSKQFIYQCVSFITLYLQWELI